MSVRAVARTLNINASTKSGLTLRFEEFGTTAISPHTLCLRMTTFAQGRYIQILHSHDRRIRAKATADETADLFNRQISPEIV